MSLPYSTDSVRSSSSQQPLLPVARRNPHTRRWSPSAAPPNSHVTPEKPPRKKAQATFLYPPPLSPAEVGVLVGGADDDAESSGSTSRQRSPVYKTTSRKGQKLARRDQGPLDYASWREIGYDFCARTSSHGVPFIGTHSFFGRLAWGLITVVAFLAFCIQTYYTLSDYFEYRTIIEMQLRFEPAPFPAVTVCNLNSFKYSELNKFEEIAQGFKLWERAISTLKERRQGEMEEARRRKRQVVYQAVYVKCVCNLGPQDQCVPQLNVLDVNASVCVCFQDVKTGDIWPCYAKTMWSEKTCYHCASSHTCDDPDLLYAGGHSLLSGEREQGHDCFCQSVSHYCLERGPNETIPWWTPHEHTSFPATDEPRLSEEVEEAFALEDLKDAGAITTKTKENLIFMVAQMPRETRRQLSYTRSEFVLRCSFNSKDCDMERDFQVQVDPEYGNCFTFESLNETAGYTLVNLFSDLGGNIGLWIGFSLITVLEFVELLFECTVFGTRRMGLHLRRMSTGTPPGGTAAIDSPSGKLLRKRLTSARQVHPDRYPYIDDSTMGEDGLMSRGRLIYTNDYDYRMMAEEEAQRRRRRSILGGGAQQRRSDIERRVQWSELH